jgi:hypothetical protein
MSETVDILSYKDLSIQQKDHFYSFLKSTQKDNKPASVNMWHDDWQNNNRTLPYILEYTDRFKSNGTFHILYDGTEIIACGGVYISDFSIDVAICGVRTWVSKDSRHNSILREYLLPAHKEWCENQGVSISALTFNDYNKNLIQVFRRRRLGESKERISNREPKHLFYSGLHEVEFPLTIQYTKQWLIYEKLGDYDFDWKSIEWKNTR